MKASGELIYSMFASKEYFLRKGYPSIIDACKKIENKLKDNEYPSSTIFSIALIKESDTNETSIKGSS